MPVAIPNRTWLQCRQLFVKATKRYDLVTNGDVTTGADNGADHFLNMGQRWLDMNVDHPKSQRRFKDVLAIGAYKMRVDGLIALATIGITSATERIDITGNWLPYEELRGLTGGLLDNYESGMPTWWTIPNIGLAPRQLDSTTTTFDAAGQIDYGDIFIGAAASNSYDWGSDFILFDVKADAVYNVEVDGLFYSPYTTTDANKTYWTVEHPQLLVLSGALMVELENGNSSRVRDIEQAIRIHTKELDNMVVERSFQGHTMDIDG